MKYLFSLEIYSNQTINLPKTESSKILQVNGFLCSKKQLSKVSYDICFQLSVSHVLNHTADQNSNIIGQEDNQGRLRNSTSASSLGSILLSDKSFGNDGLLLLPKLKRINFCVPRYIPPNDWIRSQCNYSVHINLKLN